MTIAVVYVELPVCHTIFFFFLRSKCYGGVGEGKFLFLFLNFIYLFIFGCVGSSFLCEGFLQLQRAGATLHQGARASVVAEHRLQTCRLSSCGARA